MKEKAGFLTVGAYAMAFALLTTNGLAQDAAPATEENVAEKKETAAQANIFEPLVRIAEIKGICMTKNPDIGQFQTALEGKAYPLGTIFRTGANGNAMLLFSDQEFVKLESSTEVMVDKCEKNPNARVLRLVSGSIKTTIRDNPPEGSFHVLTDNAGCHNLSGRGEYSLTRLGAMETFIVATITGAVKVEGPQFTIPALRAANTVNIQTSVGRSLSRLMSESGDFVIDLENGSEKPLSYKMSPQYVVKIWRENAPVGGRPIVSVLTMNHKGMTQNRFAFAVGRPELATGELAVQEAPKEKEDEDVSSLLGDGEKKDAPAEEKQDNEAE